MKPVTTIAAAFFALMAFMQLMRVLMNWDVMINGMSVPLWASVVAFLVTGVLAVMVWRENAGKAT